MLWQTQLGEVAAQDFTYSTNNGMLTIVGYTGSGGAVTVPSMAFGLPVTGIGDSAFAYLSNLTSVTLPMTVSNIVRLAFWDCTNLTTIAVDPLNSTYSSADGVLFDKSQTVLILYPWAKKGGYTIPNTVKSIGDGAFLDAPSVTSVTIPNSVTNIGDQAFSSCDSLASVTIGNSVTSIGVAAFSFCHSLTSVSIPDSVTNIKDGMGWIGGAFTFCTSLTNVTVGTGVTYIGVYAFYECSSLAGVFFRGNAPSLGHAAFDNAIDTTVYYLPKTVGWGPTFGGLPSRLWNPQAQTTDGSFGVRQDSFGFNIGGTRDIPIVIEACANLSTRSWVPLQSCTLTNGSIYFSDPQWTNYSSRLYRIRSP